MKKILMLMTLAATMLFAELEWVEDYKAGLEKAKQEGKYVMVMLTKEGCPACVYMKEIVFDDDEVIAAVQKHYVPVMLDINTHLLYGLSYIGTPTFYFLGQNEVRIQRYDGGANQKDFMELLKQVEAKLPEQP